jgi:hypothetical protein
VDLTRLDGRELRERIEALRPQAPPPGVEAEASPRPGGAQGISLPMVP